MRNTLKIIISKQTKISVKSSLFIIAITAAHPPSDKGEFAQVVSEIHSVTYTGLSVSGSQSSDAVATLQFHITSATNPLFLGWFCAVYGDRRTVLSKISILVLSRPDSCIAFNKAAPVGLYGCGIDTQSCFLLPSIVPLHQ